MGRLTYEKLCDILQHVNRATFILDGVGEESYSSQEVHEAIKELQRYKDLEEQGRLIELPCAVGDTVYRTILDKVYEYTVGSFLVDENGAWGMSLLFEQEEKNFAANMDCDNLGKTVFLTKEEAEAKLKELEGDKE